MGTKTINYEFTKDDENEFYDVLRVNANLDKIDAGIKAVDDKVEAVDQLIGNINIPVKSVNNKTGNVVLSAADVGAETPSGAQLKANAAASAALNAANQYTDQEVGAVSTQMAELEKNKVDKVTGKGLSTNDYTTTEKNKLAGVEAGARKLSNVQDYGIATQAEAEAGTVNNKYITPLRASQAVRSQTGSTYGSASLSQRIEGKTEHTFTIPITPNSRNAKVFMYDGRLLVFCNTIPVETVVLSISYYDKMLTMSRRGDTDFIHSYNSMVYVRAVHIEGNNLKITIRNNNTAATTHSVDIFWEAW